MSLLVSAALIGIAVGVVVGALGAGGGILSVPILVYLLSQDPHAAAAESLVIVIATALAAMPGRIRRGHVAWRDGITVGLMSTAGAVAGSWANEQVDATVLMILFSALLLAVAVVMAHKAWRQSRQNIADGAASEPAQRRPWWVVALAATVTGVLTGFFGVGGGFIVVPMLTVVLGFDIRRASGTSLIVMIIAALASLAKRAGSDISLDWAVTIAFMLGSMAGGVVGGPLSHTVKASTLTYIFAALLLAVALFSGVQTLLQ